MSKEKEIKSALVIDAIHTIFGVPMGHYTVDLQTCLCFLKGHFSFVYACAVGSVYESYREEFATMLDTHIAWRETSEYERTDKSLGEFLLVDELYKAANDPEIEQVVLMSGNAHLVPAVKALHKANKKVVVCCHRPWLSHPLREVVDEWIDIAVQESHPNIFKEIGLILLSAENHSHKLTKNELTSLVSSRNRQWATSYVEEALQFMLQSGYCDEKIEDLHGDYIHHLYFTELGKGWLL